MEGIRNAVGCGRMVSSLRRMLNFLSMFGNVRWVIVMVLN